MVKKHRASWWFLYLLIPMMFGAFWIEMHMSLSTTGHQVAELGIFLLIYALISLWLKANAGAIMHEDLERCRRISGMALKLSEHPSMSDSLTNVDSKHRTRSFWQSVYAWLVFLASTMAHFFTREV